MAIRTTHKFVSQKADGADDSLIRPSNWNAEHNLGLLGPALIGRATANQGDAQEITLGGGLQFSGTTLNVGGTLTGTIQAPRVRFSDPNFYAEVTGSDNTLLLSDSGDYYSFNRASNSHRFFVNNSERFNINESSVVVTSNLAVGGMITFVSPASPNRTVANFGYGYSLNCENPGVGASNTRLWIDTPDTGEVIIGPRSGSSWLHQIRLRANSTRMEGSAVVTENLTVSGNIAASGNVSAYSDERLKKDISTIDSALSMVEQMRGVSYTRKETGERQVGVIAQEIRKVLPEVVQEGTDDEKTLSVAYGNIVGVLIEAIKELKAEVDELKRDK